MALLMMYVRALHIYGSFNDICQKTYTYMALSMIFVKEVYVYGSFNI